MAVNVTCPGCRTSYPVTEDLLGKKIRCKKCQETFTAAMAKSAVGARAADERITSRQPAKGGNGRYEGDDDDTPRRNGNGKARPMAQRPAAKSGGKGWLIGAIGGGVLLLAVGVGVGLLIINKDDPAPNDNKTVASISNTPPISTPTVTAVPDATANAKAEPEKPAPTTNAEMKTADAPSKLTVVHQPRPADIRPETIQRVQKSAAYFTVNMAEGLAWGSGWIAERHGNEAYVVTNSHVVGMKEPAKPPPEKVDVCLDSGLPSERHFEGKILALDREEDLCVVRIKGKDLPDPLKISPSYDLVESQRLTTLGFPQGGMLAKGLQRGLGTGELKTTLRTRPSTVSGRIFNKDGSVKYISAEGGVDGGNSGGAVVDTNGNVCCVVVAGSTSSNMRFFIPSEYVVHLLLGRVLKIVPGQAIASGGSIRQPILATVADPLQRLRKVDAEVWTGPKPDESKGEKIIRIGGNHEPEPKTGDGQRTVATLTYDPSRTLALGDAHRAEAELTLPVLKDNEVYWFQPHYYAKDGSERWGEAVVMEMGRYPVDAKAAHLALVHKADLNPNDARPIEIDSRQAFAYELEGLGAIGNDLGLKARLTERVTEVKNGDAKVLLQYKDLRLDDAVDDSLLRKQFKGVLEAVKWLKATVTITKDGRYTMPNAIVADVPSDARPLLKTFNSQIVESLEVMALSLPGKEVQPGESWEHETAYTFSLGDKNNQNALFKMTCKYIGSRMRDGREEAVVEITGRVARDESKKDSNSRDGLGGAVGRGGPGAPGDSSSSDDDEEGGRKFGFTGFIHGAAAVDVATGQVTLARTESDMAVAFPATLRDPSNPQNSTTVKVYAALYLDVVLRRGIGRQAPKAADVMAVLPDQPRTYRPLVGVGAPDGTPAADTTSISTEPLIPERSTLMAQDVFDRVKHSAVMFMVERNDGASEGSGWFAAPGIIVTNCHVVGMLNKADRPPEKITVYLDRGTDKERKFSGELLAVNREDDLAVVRITGDNLPSPLKISPSASLVEATRLNIMGFPNGSGLAKGLEQGLGLASRDLQTTLKTRPTTVNGRILNKIDDSVKYISFEGGADHGNSGGPIVDSKGELRAVLVAGDPRSELRFGIPSEYADRMVQGYPLEILPGRSYMDESIPKQPIEVRFSDPLGKLTSVAIDYWVGNSGKQRKPSDKTPKPAAGDGPRQTLPLKLKTSDRPGERLASGEFVLPRMDPGQICWLQPRFTNGTGKEQWSKAIVYAPDGPPVERKPALLAVRNRTGTSREVDLISYTSLYANKLGRVQGEGMPLKVTLNETVRQVNPQGALIQIEYQNLEFDIKKILPGLEDLPPQIESMLSQQLKPFLGLIRGVAMIVNVSKDGHMKIARNGLSYGRLPLGAQVQMAQFNNQIFTSLQSLTFPLPGKQVPYGYTWDFPTDLFIPSKNRSDGANFKMQFKYVGVRDRSGRPEAVVEITGSLIGNPNAKGIDATDDKEEPAQPATPADPMAVRLDQSAPADEPKKSKKGLYGVAHGYALVDVNDGFVGEVKLYLDLTMEMLVKDPLSKKEIPVDEGGTMELQLRRRTAKVGK